MKKILFTIAFALFVVTINAQEVQQETIHSTEKPAKSKRLQSAPEYPGGIKEFYNFIMPKIQRSMSYSPGHMIVTFIIEPDGSLSNIKTEKGITEKFDERVREIISKSPKWKPGQQEGKPLRVLYRLPLRLN